MDFLRVIGEDPDSRWTNVKCLIAILIAGVISYKIIDTPFNLQMDFPALLSLLLALFTIGLSAMFYFKATDTSNTFYYNTYKFTKDIAELLVRIESGFGERLKHLDESYQSMLEHYGAFPHKDTTEDTKKEIKLEEKELENKLQQRDSLINELVARAKLQEGEKAEFVSRLKEQDEALQRAHQDMFFLKQKLSRSMPESIVYDYPAHFIDFIRKHVIPTLDLDFVARGSLESLKRRFRQIHDGLPKAFLDELKEFGLLESEGLLSQEGLKLIRNLARVQIHNKSHQPDTSSDPED